MKYVSLLLLVLVPSVSLSESHLEAPPQDIIRTVQYLQPRHSQKMAKKIAGAVYHYSKSINVDWRLFLSILYQESSLDLDPQKCMEKEFEEHFKRVKTKKHSFKYVKIPNRKCEDYGISQINWKTWGKEMQLDKKLLLTDVDYSVKAAANILAFYKTKHSRHDRRWHLRYHSATPYYKAEYEEYIKRRYNRIKRYVTSIDKDSK